MTGLLSTSTKWATPPPSAEMKYHKMYQHIQIFLSNFVPQQEICLLLDDEMFLFITLHCFLLWTGDPHTLAAVGTRCTDIHCFP